MWYYPSLLLHHHKALQNEHRARLLTNPEIQWSKLSNWTDWSTNILLLHIRCLDWTHYSEKSYVQQPLTLKLLHEKCKAVMYNVDKFYTAICIYCTHYLQFGFTCGHKQYLRYSSTQNKFSTIHVRTSVLHPIINKNSCSDTWVSYTYSTCKRTS